MRQLLFWRWGVFQDKQYYHFFYNYVDDAAIVSRTLKKHLRRIVFQTVRANNLSLNPTKTNIGFNEIEFLRFTVSHKAIKVSHNGRLPERKTPSQLATYDNYNQ